MLRTISAAIGFAALAAAPAHSERVASYEQRQALSGVLEQMGVESWDDLKLEDEGYWAIDDAHLADGTCADFKIAEDDFQIIERQIEDCPPPPEAG